MFNVTAEVIPQNEECSVVTVTVKGNNLGSEVAEHVARWALCMEFGVSFDELNYFVEDIMEEPSEVLVTFEVNE